MAAEFAPDGHSINRYQPYPRVAMLSEGISWPKGQALPIFAAPAASLDAIEVQGLSRDEQITFSSLQGQVNRKIPRIYLLDARTDEGRDTWAETAVLKLPSQVLFSSENKYDLLSKYAGELEGVVIYDPSLSPHYRNLAGTVAGLRRALPVTAEVYERMQEQGIKLDVLIDLTQLKAASPVEVYEHLYEHYWQHCEKRLLVSARPSRRGDFHHTRDIAAACGAAVVWLDNRILELQKDLAGEFPGQTEFVRADHYFNLYNRAHGLPFNLVMSAKTKIRSGDALSHPARAGDGTPATLWTAAGMEARWLELDFGDTFEINRCVLRHAGDHGMDPRFNTRAFRVQVRADQEPWETILVVRGNTANVTDIELNPVHARLVRIKVDDAGADSMARIADVEVFGSKPVPEN